MLGAPVSSLVQGGVLICTNLLQKLTYSLLDLIITEQLISLYLNYICLSCDILNQ